MNLRYIIAHTAIQSMVVTLALIILPFFGAFAAAYGMIDTGLILAALFASKVFIFVGFEMLNMKKGAGRDLLSMFVSSGIVIVMLWVVQVTDIGKTWLMLLGILMLAYLMAWAVADPLKKRDESP